MREGNTRKKSSGFTLVEVLVAVAILAVISIPVLQSFVSVAQVNSKSRRRLSATTIAENLMESCKGISLKEVAAQCNSSGLSGHEVALTIVDSGVASEVNPTNVGTPVTASDRSVSWDSTDGYVFNVKDNYAFYIHNIVSGSARYDAVVIYSYNSDRSKENGAVDVAQELNSAGLNTLRYYEVTVKVYRAVMDQTSLPSSTPLVTIDGSVVDCSK